MATDLKDKIFLVTGASSGIGRAVSVELAAKGAKLVLLGRNEPALLETAAQMPGTEYLAMKADLNDFTIFPGIVEQMLAWHGHIDGMAYCAGIGGRARLKDTTPEYMRERMNINCFAFVELMRCLSKMKKKTQPFQAVAISSLAAIGHDKYLTAYAASKAALEAAAKSLAVELLPRNVRVNLVRCAFVATPMVLDYSVDTMEDVSRQLVESGYQPMGIIPPGDVATLVSYLLGPDAMYSTGSVFSINAGAPC